VCGACRVLERYPSNAKLLKAYAKFVEEVQHDPWRANRYYRCGLAGQYVTTMCLAGSCLHASMFLPINLAVSCTTGGVTLGYHCMLV
jgi:hypothetical protein